MCGFDSARSRHSFSWLEGRGSRKMGSVSRAVVLFPSGFCTVDALPEHADHLAALRRAASVGACLYCWHALLLFHRSVPAIPHFAQTAAVHCGGFEAGAGSAAL